MSEKERYLIVYEQAGQGCDHTIGCGVRIERFIGWWSEVLPHAEQEVWDMSTDEQKITSARIYRDPPACTLDVALTRAIEALESLEDCVSQEDHADAIKELEKEVKDAERDASRHESRADDAESDREDAVAAADQLLALRRELDEERERTRVALKRIETLALSLRTEAQRDRVRKDMVRVNAQNLADVVAREIEVRSP